MNYLSYSIESRFVADDNQTYYWAEFLFVDENDDEQWAGSGPDYTQGSPDFHCLREGALEVDSRLRAGEDWEAVIKGFRQSW